MGESLTTAGDGTGPLLQREYRATIASPSLTPEQLMLRVRHRFEELSPESTAAFARADAEAKLLKVGDELDIHIRMAGDCQVRVVHVDPTSMTLQTLEGHPEAGRISFGAERDGDRLLFRIRSRARAADAISLLGYLMIGKAMQTETWQEFARRAAELAGGRLVGEVEVDTRAVDESTKDRHVTAEPTFLHP